MRRAHRDVEVGQRRADQVDDARAGRRRAPPARWPARRLGAYGDRRLERVGRRRPAQPLRPPRPGRRRRPRSAAAARPRRGRASPTSQTETPYCSCAQARAARTGIRCSANIAAKSASSPTRSGAITVTRVPSSVVLDGDRGRAPAYLLRDLDVVGDDRRQRDPGVERGPGAPGQVADQPGPPRRPGLRRGRLGVRLGEREQQVERLGALEPLGRPARPWRGRRGRGWWRSRRAAGASAPAGRSGRRPRARSPSGSAISRAIGSPATLCSVRLALADVVQQRGDHQHVGPGDLRGSARTPRCRSRRRAGRR